MTFVTNNKQQQTTIRCNHTHNPRWVDLKCTQIKQRQYKPDWRCTIHTPTTTPSTDNTTAHHQQITTHPLINNNQPKDKNIVILQININDIRNKIEELKKLVHSTQPDIITIQETKLTQKAKTPRIPHYTIIRTDREHTQGRGLIILIKDDITFTNIQIPKAINTHNTELQLIKINKTKDITVAYTYLPLRDTTSPHYNTVDTDIAYCIRHVINIPDSILTGDVNAHSTLWYSHTDDHRGQLISDKISSSEHIILNTGTPTRVPHTTLPQATSPDITTYNLHNIIQPHNRAHNTRTKLRSPSHNHNNQHTHQIQTTTKQTHIHEL